MKRIIILSLILFISFVYSASSLKTFDIEETEKLSLGLETEDADVDALTYTFTEPLDENGEWQTTYGDAGEYESIITVSDGVNEASEEILITVNRKEAEPVIDNFLPKEDFLTIDEGSSIKFKVEASDLNDDVLKYEWKVNDEVVSENEEFVFETSYQDAGEYKINIVINDGVSDVSREWNVNVGDINFNDILEQINDITILETEKASLEIPDFGRYGLSYSISDPIGNDNVWETGYDDAGNYIVMVLVEGKGFEGEKEVNVMVKNKDRAPKMVGLNNAKMKENEQFSIAIEVVDPDNDNIIFSVENIPQNAKLEENIFTFTPGYDFVQKNNIFDYVLDKFKILSRSVNVGFVAQSNELIDKKNIKITVKDANRPFVLEGIDDMEINEGEQIVIDPRYNDPDNDRVSFSYSGFMNRNKKKLDFDDAGEYVVKVVATDGYFTQTKLITVKVNDVNRKLSFNKIENLEVSEDDEVRIELSASDSDNDAVGFSAENLPNGAKLKGNFFVWKPGLIVNGTKKEFSVDFTASDGTDEVKQKVKITVLNVNQAPKIIDYSGNLIVLKDEPVLFEINAVDADGDKLSYSWNFGFFSKFEGENKHQRIFTTTGSKEVEVVVSDGLESVSKVWNVEVV
ncbi:hypothetical protein CMO94_04185 [Candidatus Woesearchaeota archaeon]|jgi:hypothetical protein|nr:hypothetical protein [Candidatus Woesearchaeota archaeon]